MKTLADFCDVTMGQAPDGASYNATNDGLPLIAGASDLGETTPATTRWTSAPTQTCQKGDIVLCIRATIGDRNWADRTYCLGRGVAGLRAKRERMEPRYLWHWLASATPLLLHAARGATFLQVGRKDIETLPCVPPKSLAEQRRIADILDRADDIRRKRKQAIALTDELLRSAFLDMFGDPLTNPKKWELVSLVRIAQITTGNTPSRAISDYYGDDIEWIKSDNINTPNHYLTCADEGLSAKGKAVGRTAPAGSSLITCIAGSPECIGNVALADREVAFNQQINAVTPREGVDHRFLYALLFVGKRLVQSASTNSMKGMVSKGKLEGILVPAPPEKLQRKFGDMFDRMLEMTRRQEAAVREAGLLFGSTMQRAFKGQLISAEASC